MRDNREDWIAIALVLGMFLLAVFAVSLLTGVVDIERVLG